MQGDRQQNHGRFNEIRRVSSISLNVELYSPVSVPALEGLNLLFNNLTPIISSYSPEYLRSIVIVRKEKMAALANSLIQEITGNPGGYSTSPYYIPAGLAIPCEIDNALHCLILFASETIEFLTPAKYHHPEVVSMILEEFLHVWNYGQIWERQGFLSPKLNVKRPCEFKIAEIIFKQFDEYITNRLKSEILGTVPLIDHEQGGLTTGKITFQGTLSTYLHECESELCRTIARIAARKRTVGEEWELFLANIYRRLLEPLARTAAFNDACQLVDDDNLDPSLLHFFEGQFINPWKLIHKQLQVAFTTPELTNEAMEHCIRQLCNFLTKIGITFNKSRDGGCYVLFNAIYLIQNGYI